MFSERVVRTPVGALVVRISERHPDAPRPTAVFWHSLFVDSRSWSRVENEFAQDRDLVMITGPGHGASGDPGHGYSMTDCAAAAAAVLDALGITAPVDWVGNAWGGHVGVLFATRYPERCRSLVTVGTPVHAYARQARAKTQALLLAHRLFGPVQFLRDGVVHVLLSSRTLESDPAAVELVGDCFTNADRAMLRNAVISISLRRTDLTPQLPLVQPPTLFITGDAHPDWSPEQAARAARLLPRGSASVLEGAAYLGPLEAPDEFARQVREFWVSQGAYVTGG